MSNTSAVTKIQTMVGWTGDVETLSEEVRRFRIDHPHFDPDWSPTPRGIRYYATQDILSPPERTGRQAQYGYFHLIQLLAARALIAAGLKLSEVKDRLQGAKEDDFLKYIERRLADAAAAREGIAADPLLADASLARSDDRKKALAEVMRRLEPDPKKTRPRPVFKTMTRLAITEWCHLLMGRKELRNLTPEQARDIGFAVAAALMDPDIRRGAGGTSTEDGSESGDPLHED